MRGRCGQSRCPPDRPVNGDFGRNRRALPEMVLFSTQTFKKAQPVGVVDEGVNLFRALQSGDFHFIRIGGFKDEYGF